jgi:aminobenzoyl-glutamate utilization protein B
MPRRPRQRLTARLTAPLLALLLAAPAAGAQPPAAPAAADTARLARLKAEAARLVDSLRVTSQQMVDQVFSYGELGFHEVETARYLTGVLRRHGFAVRDSVSGIPDGVGGALGLGEAGDRPRQRRGRHPAGVADAGVAFRRPLVEGAPGHGEGHNAGVPLNVTAAVALKRIMEREKLPGTIMLWPGTAEELVAGKAYFVRDGMFRDVDAVLFTHVSSDFSTSWGGTSNNGLVSVEYAFRGSAAHAAGAPWRGRSALDAVSLMDVGWNFRREHLRLQQRSHSVVTDGGDQPNVVPTTARAWYYFRETDYPRIMSLWAQGDSVARGAAMMAGVRLDTVRVLGAAWPQHFNRPIAEAMHANIRRVGMPRWDDADQALARGIQRETNAPGYVPRGLDSAVAALAGDVPDEQKRGGGSDDIGDVSWVVPTVTLRFPSNIPDLPGHHWANAVSMATPLAHKGVTAGAKAQAMTALDLLLTPRARRRRVALLPRRADEGHQVHARSCAPATGR